MLPQCLPCVVRSCWTRSESAKASPPARTTSSMPLHSPRRRRAPPSLSPSWHTNAGTYTPGHGPVIRSVRGTTVAHYVLDAGGSQGPGQTELGDSGGVGGTGRSRADLPPPIHEGIFFHAVGHQRRAQPEGASKAVEVGRGVQHVVCDQRVVQHAPSKTGGTETRLLLGWQRLEIVALRVPGPPAVPLPSGRRSPRQRLRRRARNL